MQATVEDVASFKVWAKEAFELWRSNWAVCYEVRMRLPSGACRGCEPCIRDKRLSRLCRDSCPAPHQNLLLQGAVSVGHHLLELCISPRRPTSSPSPFTCPPQQLVHALWLSTLVLLISLPIHLPASTARACLMALHPGPPVHLVCRLMRCVSALGVCSLRACMTAAHACLIHCACEY